MRPLVCDWKNLADEVLQPLFHRPNHPFQLARFGAAALCPASLLAKLFLRREESRALFAGMAAHSFLPLEALGSASFGLVLGMAGHAVGWPLPRGGSQAIAEALAGYLRELGGTIELDRRITDLKQLPRARVVLLDVTPWQFVRMAGARLPSSYRSRLERFSTRPAFSKWIMRSPLRFHGRPKHVVGLEPSMWVEIWTKSPPGSGKWRKENIPSTHSCW